MHIQPITSLPNFNGKLIVDKSVKSNLDKLFKESQIVPQFEQINSLIQKKPYDVFIYADKKTPDFYYVAANKSQKQAKEIKEYTVKIQPEIMLASIVDAARDAIEIYENFLSKSIKR